MACKTINSSRTSTPVIDMHNSQNALDWSGQYTGHQTCSHCSGITISYILNTDATVSKFQAHQGQESIDEIKGHFTWENDGQHIQILYSDNSTERIRVEENHLTLLHNNLPNHKMSRLYKMHEGIEEKYWKLIWIYDQMVTKDDFPNKEPHIIFKSHQNFCQGGDGCAPYVFTYSLDILNRLKIKNDKDKSCTDWPIAPLFHQAMDEVYEIHLEDGYLFWLDSHSNIIAKFENVYLR